MKAPGHARGVVLAHLALLVLPVASAVAGEWALRLDPASTHVSFTLGATLHKVHGLVPLREGEVRFDPATGRSSGRLVLDATGVVTANESRDKVMHTKVLESARFPEITLELHRVELAVDDSGSGTVTFSGTLAIHGLDHAFTATARVARAGERVRAEGGFDVPYVAWGMRDPSAFVMRVAKVVQVNFSTVGTLRQLGDGAGAP